MLEKFHKAGRRSKREGSEKDVTSEMLNPAVDKADEDNFGNSERGPTNSEITRGQEYETRWLESDKEWNEKILKAWENQRKSWREQEEWDRGPERREGNQT